jgi:hypothetical protein
MSRIALFLIVLGVVLAFVIGFRKGKGKKDE